MSPENSHPDTKENGIALWQKEIADLNSLITSIKLAVGTDNQEAQKGFQSLLSDVQFLEVELLIRYNHTQLPKFIQAVLETFQKSSEINREYSGELGPRNSSNQLQRYPRCKNHLTPREIRLLTYHYGFSGTTKAPIELIKQEGITSVGQSTDSAVIKITRILSVDK